MKGGEEQGLLYRLETGYCIQRAVGDGGRGDMSSVYGKVRDTLSPLEPRAVRRQKPDMAASQL